MDLSTRLCGGRENQMILNRSLALALIFFFCLAISFAVCCLFESNTIKDDVLPLDKHGFFGYLFITSLAVCIFSEV